MSEVLLVHQLQRFQGEMVERLRELVEHESPSSDKPALDRLARLLRNRFAVVGAEATLLSNVSHGDHVRVFLPATGVANSRRPALVLCHFDTVWPKGTLAERPFRIEQGRAWGPGSYDMKASIVLIEFALRSIQDLGCEIPRPIVVLLTSDEEVGSRTSRSIIESHAAGSEYVLVLEPPLPGGALKTARKGLGTFVMQIRGRAAHAGIEPERGASAIQELAHQVLRLYSLGDPSRGITVNVGVVRGGTNANVVADRATAEIDVRAATVEDARRVEEAVLASAPVTPGVQIEVTGSFHRPPMERGPEVAALFHRAKQIARRLGLELREGSTGGASDANLSAALGIPTLDGLGPLGDGAHADHEHVIVESIPQRTALLASFLLLL